jgi:hypothetical protein
MRTFILLALFAVCALAADVTGTWKGSIETPNGSRDVTMHLKSDGGKLTGTVSGRQGDVEIQDGKIDGDNVSFAFVRGDFKMEYKGKVSGDQIKFDITMGDRTIQMTAKKQ